MVDTIFQKILAREVPAEIVFENEHVLAFLDIKPVNPGHTLVIPKQWSENVLTIEHAAWTHVMEAVHMLAPVLVRAVSADGINLMMNNGQAAGQLVLHSHVHLIPRFTGDGFEHWPGTPADTATLKEVGRTIRAHLA